MVRTRGVGVVLGIVALGILPAAGLAQESTGKAAPATIRVTGEATITAKPDQAEINLGVVTQASTGQAAAAHAGRAGHHRGSGERYADRGNRTLKETAL